MRGGFLCRRVASPSRADGSGKSTDGSCRQRVPPGIRRARWSQGGNGQASMIKPGCIAGSWFAGLFLFCGGATAQESIASKICQLAEVASLDAKTSPDGTLYFTGDVDGH